MMFVATVIIASCCCTAIASEIEVPQDQTFTEFAAPEIEKESHALFQNAKVFTPGVLHSPMANSALLKDNLDIEAALFEDESSIDPEECQQQPEKTLSEQVASLEQVALEKGVLSLDGLADFMRLFQDLIWFGIAFFAFCIWRCFADMEKTAEKLSKAKEATDKDQKQAPDTLRTIQKGSVPPMEVDALVRAMYSDNKDDLRKFLDERSVNARDEAGCCTALHVAAHYSCLPAAEALLARGADVNVRDVWDETPLHFAARAGNVEVCTLLMGSRADTNAKNADDCTPLIAAAAAQKADICELLLDHGAHAGGALEEDLPLMLNTILQRRILLEGIPRVAA